MKMYVVELVGFNRQVLGAAEFSDRAEAARAARSTFQRSGGRVRSVRVVDADGDVVAEWLVWGGGRS